MDIDPLARSLVQSRMRLWDARNTTDDFFAECCDGIDRVLFNKFGREMPEVFFLAEPTRSSVSWDEARRWAIIGANAAAKMMKTDAVEFADGYYSE